MHVYTLPGGFGAIQLVPQDFYKFWTANPPVDNVLYYVKPLESLPDINWEINLTADEWRNRISTADPDYPIPLSTLREIPDSYVEAVLLNVIYGYNMQYNNGLTVYLPLRVGYSFNTDPIVWPGYALAVLGIKTLIAEYTLTGDTVKVSQATTLRALLRHVTYVASRISRDHTPLVPTGNLIVAGLDNSAAPGSSTLVYDNAAFESWLDAGGTETLAVADWVLNNRIPDATTIARKDELLAEWLPRIDLTA